MYIMLIIQILQIILFTKYIFCKPYSCEPAGFDHSKLIGSCC